jgi:hypothetical protein
VSKNKLPGTEFIGGIQLEITPHLSDDVKFIRLQHNTTKSSWLPQRLDTSEDLFRTPRELGVAPGQRLLMSDVLGQKIRADEL